jgi:hypothetical protein
MSSFMVPEIIETEWYEVEANHGETHVVPIDACGICVTQGECADYVEGSIDDPDALTVRKSGWMARLSAPGFLDCTDWITCDSYREAVEALLEAYGTADDLVHEEWERDLVLELCALDGQGRFAVIEYSSGYEVMDRVTNQTAWMSDGVDVMTSDDPDAPAPEIGTEEFRAAWEAALNDSADETLEAYFRAQYDIESNW